MADVDKTAVLFTLPRRFRPNYDSSFLVPMVQPTNAKQHEAGRPRSVAAVATVVSTGEVSFEPSLHRATYSLGHMLQVPLEVKPGNSTLLEENSPWIITTGLHAHYHRLSMGDGVTFCVLAGSIETNWKSGEKEKIVSSLHPECTGSYSAGFSMAANVKVNGKQHQIDNTKEGAAWLLTLTTDKKLALWAKSPPTARVTLSLGGVVLASKSSGQPRSGLGPGSNLGEGDRSGVEELSPEAFELSRVARNGSPEMSRQ